MTVEAFDFLVYQIKELMPTVLQAKGVNINDLNSDYCGAPVTVHSNDFLHLLDNDPQSRHDKLMNIGCALLNIGYENFYFSLQSGNINDGYSYDLFIIYTTDIG